MEPKEANKLIIDTLSLLHNRDPKLPRHFMKMVDFQETIHNTNLEGLKNWSCSVFIIPPEMRPRSPIALPNH